MKYGAVLCADGARQTTRVAGRKEDVGTLNPPASRSTYETARSPSRTHHLRRRTRNHHPRALRHRCRRLSTAFANEFSVSTPSRKKSITCGEIDHPRKKSSPRNYRSTPPHEKTKHRRLLANMVSNSTKPFPQPAFCLKKIAESFIGFIPRKLENCEYSVNNTGSCIFH